MVVDRKLSFEEHFDYIEGKTNRISAELGRILPNLRGPREVKRKLYANVVASVVLYAASVWSGALVASRRGREKLDQLMRKINIRVIAGYRTVSLEASSLLARIPPLHLQASERTRVYHRVQDLKEQPNWSEAEVKRIKDEEALLTRRQWELQLQRPVIAGTRTRDAILPHFNEWLDRAHGGATFHLTQILMGHGCFGSYLHRIQRLDTAECLHCGSGEADTAEHTLQVCDAWTVDREALQEVLGQDLRLTAIIKEISTSKEAWKAMVKFSDEVMEAKEECEREREAQMESNDSPSTPSPRTAGIHLRSSRDDVPPP